MSKADFDAVVIGSGITGGWAAKELTEGGLNVLMIERGRNVVHAKDYTTEFKEPWQVPFRGNGDSKLNQQEYPIQSMGPMSEFSRHFWVKDKQEPYQTSKDKPFNWYRGYQLGGRSLTWGRQSLRRSAADFEANKKDGHGVDWPIRYADVAPWYDHVEEFIGVSGKAEGVSSLPDGKFIPAMDLNCVESYLKDTVEKKFPGRVLTIGRTANLTTKKEGRGLCQMRSQCERGCSWGGYFSTQSSTLPAAQKTGRLSVITDSRVVNITHDPVSKRATGVDIINEKTRDRKHYTARIIFLCASTFNSVQLLLQSSSEAFPNGFANSSGVLGHYIMDHFFGPSAMGMVPGFEKQVDKGRRPTYSLVAPFRNRDGDTKKVDFVRSYLLGTMAIRLGWSRGSMEPGFGAEFKNGLSKPGPWIAAMLTMGEVLPYKNNFVELDHKNLDRLGFPQLKFHVSYRDNEKKMAEDSAQQAKAMLTAAGARIMSESAKLDTPGETIHEMGGAPMGHDPSNSVLNAYNQCHDVPNVFVTDGAAMSSSSAQNPSLTYMALTARACNYAIEQIKTGVL